MAQEIDERQEFDETLYLSSPTQSKNSVRKNYAFEYNNIVHVADPLIWVDAGQNEAEREQAFRQSIIEKFRKIASGETKREQRIDSASDLKTDFQKLESKLEKLAGSEPSPSDEIGELKRIISAQSADLATALAMLKIQPAALEVRPEEPEAPEVDPALEVQPDEEKKTAAGQCPECLKTFKRLDLHLCRTNGGNSE